jgi:hypothetical protein
MWWYYSARRQNIHWFPRCIQYFNNRHRYTGPHRSNPLIHSTPRHHLKGLHVSLTGYYKVSFQFHKLKPSNTNINMNYAVPWLGRLVAGLSPWSSVFNPRPVGVGFVALKVALRRGFLRVLQFFPASIIPPMLPARLIVITYWLHPWIRVLLEKLTGFQLVKNFPAFYGTRRFITAFTSASHLSLSWARLMQSIPPHPNFWRSIVITSMFIPCILNNKLFITYQHMHK